MVQRHHAEAPRRASGKALAVDVAVVEADELFGRVESQHVDLHEAGANLAVVEDLEVLLQKTAEFLKVDSLGFRDTSGSGFFLFGQELEMGTSFRMGPGYFPTILSILMIGLGAVIAAQALRAPTTEHSFGQVPWRGLLLLIGAVLFFGFVVRGVGLAPAVLIVVLATAWASRYARLRSSLPLSIGLAAFCAVLFIRLLGLPLPLTGPWLSPGYWSPPSTEAPAEPR